jgi:mannan endo-1,4-beta-mannosidase
MSIQSISTTRTGSGYFQVLVDGHHISNHKFESTAIQQAVNALAENPGANVRIVQDLEIRVEGRFSELPGDTQPEIPESGFVTAHDGDFFLDGHRLRFGATNAYYLATYESQNSAVVDRILDLCQQTGCNVIRTWGFYDGHPRYAGDPTFQPEPGVYDEKGLQCLDRAIAKGKERGLKFIIPFVNNWEQLGGLPKYREWLDIGTTEDLIQSDAFNDIFTDYISMLLNRVNTETGVAYKDEPAIHSWQVANELRVPGADPQIARGWYQKIAQHIKSEDSNHLVGTGEEGYDDASLGQWTAEGKFVHPDYQSEKYANTYVLRANAGTSYVLNIAIPEIDYGNFHWYPAAMGFSDYAGEEALNAQRAWIQDHRSITEKPVILGEYGLNTAPLQEPERFEALKGLYAPIWELCEEIGVNTMLWQLTADGTKAREFNGNISIGEGGRGDYALYDLFAEHANLMKYAH